MFSRLSAAVSRLSDAWSSGGASSSSRGGGSRSAGGSSGRWSGWRQSAAIDVSTTAASEQTNTGASRSPWSSLWALFTGTGVATSGDTPGGGDEAAPLTANDAAGNAADTPPVAPPSANPGTGSATSGSASGSGPTSGVGVGLALGPGAGNSNTNAGGGNSIASGNSNAGGNSNGGGITITINAGNGAGAGNGNSNRPDVPPGLARRIDAAVAETAVERPSFDVSQPMQINARTVRPNASTEVAQVRRAVAQYAKQAVYGQMSSAQMAARAHEAALLASMPDLRAPQNEPIRIEGYMRVRSDLREAADEKASAQDKLEDAREEAEAKAEARAQAAES